MKRPAPLAAVLALLCLLFPLSEASAQTDMPVVRAVLFYSPTCGHCERVIKGTLIPMTEQYGDRLQILALDVTQPQGQGFFQAALEAFQVESAGVPFLVIDDVYLVGSIEIPERFPGMVEAYLLEGGVDWPAIPGLVEALYPQAATGPAPTPPPVVRSVLFYRSACSHCQKLVEEAIPPLQERYGAQLEIYGIDVSKPDGEVLYQAAIERYQIDRFGVPTLILGDQVMVGGVEIEETFPGLVEGSLLQGGADWPEIPGLLQAMAKADQAQHPSAAVPTASESIPRSPAVTVISPAAHGQSTTWLDMFARDPQGNTLSVVVLLGMLGSIPWAAALFKKKRGISIRGRWGWLIPVLTLAGLGVAGYLAYVETTLAEAVCGPVGDCNAVQQSEYARLFGILPIGVLGLAGYVAILVIWLFARYAANSRAFPAALLLLVTASGTLFSIYLTFLEPFVIGATCIWCLTSAVLMTALMVASAGPAGNALSRPISPASRYRPR